MIISSEIALRWMPQNIIDDWLVNIGSGNGSVL